MTKVEMAAEPTYGNWRRPSSPGVAGLGLAGTAGLFATIILMVIGFLFSLRIGAAVAVAGGLLLAPLLLTDRFGRNGWQRAAARLMWRWSVAGGHNLYRSGPLSRVGFGTCSLSGLAAGVELIEARDALGRGFALVHHRGPGHVSVVFDTAPEGVANVDEEAINVAVAQWGNWLSALGTDLDVVGAAVTIETAPDPGHKLRREIETHLQAGAPELARATLGEIADTYPSGSAGVTSHIAVTWSRTPHGGGRRRAVDELAVEIGRRIPTLLQALAGTGAGPGRAMTAPEIAGAVRVSYDPAVASVLDELGAGSADLGWADAGPVAAEETWDSYRHDSGRSRSWFMVEAPRGHVFAQNLNRLIGPHPDIPRKRVTLLYRPYGPAAAVGIVDRDHKDALFNAAGRKVGRARDVISVAAAEQSATEEARGAGLVRFGIVITATATGTTQLDQATTAIEHLAGSSRLAVRVAYGQQASAFIAGLPLGVVLAGHVRVPDAIREAI